MSSCSHTKAKTIPAARRNWEHARDYVEMQWLMLQQDQPEDFVIATGVQHSVREFVELAAREIGIDIEWRGKGMGERGLAATVPPEFAAAMRAGQTIVTIDPRRCRHKFLRKP